jgi:hypothetical protein
MKYILAIFIGSALLAMSFANSNDFQGRFREIFSESINGFQGLKAEIEKTGQVKMPNFDKTNLFFDLNTQRHGVKMELNVQDEATGKEFMERYILMFDRTLPVGDFSPVNTHDEKYIDQSKILFDCAQKEPGERNKYPVLEMGMMKTKTGTAVVVMIYEPVVKSMYTPVFDR